MINKRDDWISATKVTSLVWFLLTLWIYYLQLPGLLSISSKFLPTFMNLIKRLAEEAQGNQTPQESQGSASQTQIFRNQVHKPDSVSTSISNVSSVGLSVDDNEYSTTNLSQRRRTNAPEAEFSWQNSRQFDLKTVGIKNRHAPVRVISQISFVLLLPIYFLLLFFTVTCKLSEYMKDPYLGSITTEHISVPIVTE